MRGKSVSFVCHVILKMIILPRQARDKHRETLGGKTCVFRRAETVLSFSLASLPATINQDVAIEISLPHGRTIRKLKRCGTPVFRAIV